MKKLSLVLCFVLILVALFAINIFAADPNIAGEATISVSGGDFHSCIETYWNDGDDSTTSNGPNTWCGCSAYVDFSEAKRFTKLHIVLNGPGKRYNAWGADTVDEYRMNTIEIMFYTKAADGTYQLISDATIAKQNVKTLTSVTHDNLNVVASRIELKWTSDAYVYAAPYEIYTYAHVECDYSVRIESDTDRPVTCLEDGIATYKCSGCDNVTTKITESPKEHTYNNGEVTLEPTFTAEGVMTFTCITCKELGCTNCPDYQYTKPISKLGHNWDNGTVTPPTCTERGYTTYKCTGCSIENCNAEEIRDYVSALGHIYDTSVITVKPTALSKGEIKYSCVCGLYYTEELDKLSWGDNTTVIKVENIVDVEEKISNEDLADPSRDWKELFDGQINSTWTQYVGDGWFAPSGSSIKLTFDKEYHVVSATVNAWANWCHATISFLDKDDNVIATFSTSGYQELYPQTNTLDMPSLAGVSNVKSVVINPTYAKGDQGQGYSFLELTITVHNHDREGDIENYVAPTCTEKGSYNETCSVCGLYYFVETPATGHTATDEGVVTAPTCTEDGYTTHVCATCGVSYTADPTKATGHEWVKSGETAPTCTEKGYTSYECIKCGETKADEIAATGHTEVVDAAVDATCTETGLTEGKHCSVCSETIVKQEVVDALGHTPSENGTVCTVCNATLIAVYIGETPYASLTEAYEAAVDDDTITLITNIDLASALYVEKRITINLNGKNITVTNDTVGDGVFCVLAGGELVIEGDGTVNGLGNNPYSMAIWAKGGIVIINGGSYTNLGASSEIDGEHFDLIYVSEGGYVEIVGGSFACETPEWTLNSKNSAPGTINVYGGTFAGFNPNANKDGECFLAVGYHAIEEDGSYTVGAHDAVVDEGKDATCTETGLTEGSHCSICGETIVKQDVINVKDHSYNEEVTAPTCTEDGYTTYTCTACGHSYTGNTVIATGHSYSEDVTAPTCTEDGYTTYTCTACGYSYTGNTVSATGHSYNEDVTAPTCTEDGYTTYTCSACGHSYTGNTVVATGHSYEATANDDGSVTYTCANDCGDSYTVNNTLFNDTYYMDSIDMLKVVFDGNGTVVIEETIGMNIAGTYTYEYITNQTKITVEGQSFFFVIDEQFNVTALYLGSKPARLTKYIPPVELEIGDNAIATDFSGKEFVVSVAGKYVLTLCEGEENAAILLIDEYGISKITLPYSFEVEEDSSVSFVICTKEGEDEVNVNLHMHEYQWWYGGEEATCTTPGTDIWECACGDLETTYLPVNPDVHPLDNIENLTEVDSTCSEYGYKDFYCSACETNVHIVYDWYGAHNFNDDGICEVCGKNAKGTAQSPIVVTIGENTFYVVEGADYTVYKIPVTYDLGKLTITIDANASIAFSTSPYDFEGMPFETGNTSYEVVLDSEELYGAEYYAIAIANCETFTVAYEEMARPELVVGQNAIVVPEIETEWGTTAGTVIFVVKTPGSYILSLADGEGNACVVLDYERLYLDEEAYEFTVAEGEVVKFSITTDNFTGDTIDLVLTSAHTHTEVEIPATFGYKLDGVVYPGMTSGKKCSVCGVITEAPVQASNGFEIPTASLSLSQDINVKYVVNIPAGYSNVYATFKLIDVAGSELVYVYEENADPSKARTVTFQYTGLKFYYMNEVVEARIYATTEDGRTVAFENNIMSVAYYSARMLNAYASYVANGNKTAIELCTLISDLLIAGDMTQIYEGYETNNLVTDAVKATGAVLTPSTKTLDAVDIPASSFTFENNEKGKDIRWSSASLSVGQATYMKLLFNATDIEGLTIKITIGNYDPIYVNASDLGEPNSSGQYTVEVRNIRAKEYGVTIKAEFLKDNEPIENGAVIYSSINTYLYNMRNNSKVNVKNLVRALYNYGAAVYAYEN